MEEVSQLNMYLVREWVILKSGLFELFENILGKGEWADYVSVATYDY